MPTRTNRRTGLAALTTVGLWALFGAAVCRAAESPAILFLGDADNHVAAGLRALEVPFQAVSARELIRGDVCLFDYRVLIGGMDVRRDGLGSIGAAIEAFVKTGGVVLGFRSPDAEPWLPSPLEKDRAYALGQVLAPEHPVFTTPHEIGRASCRERV